LKVFFGELKEIKAVIREKARCKSQKTKNRRGGACLLPLLTKKGRKMKFRPEITRVKLNPEQAVLSCSCHSEHNRYHPAGPHWDGTPRWVMYEGDVLCGHPGIKGAVMGTTHFWLSHNPDHNFSTDRHSVGSSSTSS